MGGLKEILRLFRKQRVCSELDAESANGKEVLGWCRISGRISDFLFALCVTLGLQVFLVGVGLGLFLWL